MNKKVWMNSDPCRFRKISKLKPRPKKKLARSGTQFQRPLQSATEGLGARARLGLRLGLGLGLRLLEVKARARARVKAGA